MKRYLLVRKFPFNFNLIKIFVNIIFYLNMSVQEQLQREEISKLRDQVKNLEQKVVDLQKYNLDQDVERGLQIEHENFEKIEAIRHEQFEIQTKIDELEMKEAQVKEQLDLFEIDNS